MNQYLPSLLLLYKNCILKIEKLTHLGNKFFPSEEETKSEIDKLLDVTELYEITIEHMSGKIVEEK